MNENSSSSDRDLTSISVASREKETRASQELQTTSDELAMMTFRSSQWQSVGRMRHFKSGRFLLMRSNTVWSELRRLQQSFSYLTRAKHFKGNCSSDITKALTGSSRLKEKSKIYLIDVNMKKIFEIKSQLNVVNKEVQFRAYNK